MARRHKRKTAAKRTALQLWQRHTRRLLDQLQGQRKTVVNQLTAIDHQIETVTGALGSAPARKKAPAKRKVRGRRRGGVSASVLKALAGGKSLSIDRLVSTTGLDRRQVYACLMSLKKVKRVNTVGRGVYCLAGGKVISQTPAKKQTRFRAAVKRPRVGTKKKAAKRGGRGAVSGAILKTLNKTKGHSVADIVKATGLELMQVRAGVMNLKKAKKVVARKRGVFHLA